MAVESEDDRAAFFDADEFGVAATYTYAAGGTAAVTVILSGPGARLGAGVLGIDGDAWTADLNRDDLSANPVAGDSFVVDGTGTFTVRRAVPRTDRNVWNLELKKTA